MLIKTTMEDLEEPSASEMPHTFYCNSCALETQDVSKFTSYWLQTDVLRQEFITEELLLCFICKRSAEKAERLIKNLIQFFKHDLTVIYKDGFQKPNKANIVTRPLLNLKQISLDSTSLSGKDLEQEPNVYFEGFKDECGITKDLEPVGVISQDVERDRNGVTKELEREGNVGVKVKEEVEDGNMFDNLEGEFLDDDNDLRLSDIKEEDEYPLKLLKQELELEEVRVKCFKKEKKKKKIKKRKGGKTKKVDEKPQLDIIENKVEKFHITKEQLYEERKQAAEDKIYLNSIYQCSTCIKGFSFKASYDKHMKSHDESNGDFVCDICMQRMDTNDKLKNHYRCHTMRYRCTVCGLTRSNKLCIMDHYTAKHGEGLDPYFCPHCPKKFLRKVGLRKHIIYLHKRTSKVECQYCQKTYVNQQSLKAHCIRRHPMEVSSVKRLKKNTCEDCGMAFASPSQLRNHRVKHSERKDYYCVECDKSFKSNSILKNHLKTASPHVNYTELPLPCEHCDKRFAIRRDLENHTNRIHLNIKPYQCDQCEKAYINSWGLKEHRRLTHEGYKRPLRFPCTMCDKVFDRNQILKSHIRTHTGERPYQCSKCPAQFSQASVLGTHVKLIHLKLTRDGRPKTGHVGR